MTGQNFKIHYTPIVEWKENNALVREYCCMCHTSFNASVPLFELIGVGYLCDSCARNQLFSGSTKKERKAHAFAEKKHNGQKDDSGGDYFHSHILNVVEIVKRCEDINEKMVVATYLHDTLEDTKTTYEELVKEFGKGVADLVVELTHKGNPETGYYFPKLKSKEAIIIKFADRLSNLSRMSCWNENRQNHYLKNSQFWTD